mmetsp:Transcript_63409/g.125418  ORF Transcript_63409/g.125418 Transcript_63409/m.125418 type:complete len:220 (-) Transcript_63409:538-1197(-)
MDRDESGWVQGEACLSQPVGRASLGAPDRLVVGDYAAVGAAQLGRCSFAHTPAKQQAHPTLHQHGLEDRTHTGCVLRHQPPADEAQLEALSAPSMGDELAPQPCLHRQGQLNPACSRTDYRDPHLSAGRQREDARENGIPTFAEAIDRLDGGNRGQRRLARGRMRGRGVGVDHGLGGGSNVDREHIVCDGRPALEKHSLLLEVEAASLGVHEPSSGKGG